MENIKDLKIQLSKNGIFISNLVTYGLLVKNLPSHYKFCKSNMAGKLLNEKYHETPYEALMELLKNKPEINDRLAIIQDREVTYKQMVEEANAFSKYLHNYLKLQKGEKVSICADSSIEGIEAFFAMNKLGLANARIFNGSQEEKMLKNLKDFESSTIITDERNLKVLNNVINDSNLKNVVICGSSSKKVEEFKNSNKSVNIILWSEALDLGSKIEEDYKEDVKKEDLAAILYTSGSSGEPKPISIPNQSYVNMVEIVSKTTNIKKGDPEKVVGVVSHEYPYAAINSTMMILLMGKTLLMPKHNENGLDFNELLEEKPERIQAIPNFYKLLETFVEQGKLTLEDLRSLKCVVSGGETYLKTDKKDLLNLLMKIKSSALLIDGFGFGEMGSATALKFGLSDYFLLMNGIEAKAIDPETGKDLGLDEEGVLCLSGPTIADNYYANEEATKKSFITDENGKKWFVSDTYGSVHGKLKRLIKLGGRIREYFITGDGNGSFVKVYAGNVEDVILSSELVKECVVVPSDTKGLPTSVAYVSLKETENLTTEQIINEIYKTCERLESFAKPTEINIEEEIHRTKALKKDYTYYKEKQFAKTNQ